MLKQIALLGLVGTLVGPVFGQETKSFTYKKTKQADLAIFVHYPPGWKDTDKRPGIVFFGCSGSRCERRINPRVVNSVHFTAGGRGLNVPGA